VSSKREELLVIGVGGARVLMYMFKVKKTITKALGGRSTCLTIFFKAGQQGKADEIFSQNGKRVRMGILNGDCEKTVR
jgi:hypothetical protein